MKTLSFSLLAAALATGLASATTAFTTPVGYTTTAPLAPSQFNLMSVTVHESTVAAGVIDAESSGSITDNEINFTTLLGAANPPTTPTYILELPNGVIQEIISWSGNVLTTPQDITASVVPGTTTYKLRKADTISSIFGATNQAGLTPSPDGDLTVCDLIQIYNGAGFDTVYYFDDGSTEGWFTDANDPAENKPIIYADGFYVKRVAGSTINLVISGEVKTKPTSGMLTAGFNYLGGVAPVGLNLGNSGLEDFITTSPDGDLAACDTVLLPTTGGVYITCYYFDDGSTTGWFTDANDPAESLAITDGLLIFNIGGTKPYTISVPTSYNNL